MGSEPHFMIIWFLIKFLDNGQTNFAAESFVNQNETLHLVRFVSGIPLASAEDPTGGYGDVVANLYMAREFKKRFPSIQVELIITTEDPKHQEFPKPGVARSDDIIKALTPQLDPTRTYEVQTVDGIGYIFTDIYFKPLPGNKGFQGLYLHPDKLAEIPEADISIHYSANCIHFYPINSKQSLSYYELNAGNALESMNTGFQSLGIYLSKNLGQPSAMRKQTVKKWLQDFKSIDLDENRDLFTIAYAHSAISQEIYLAALSRLAQNQPHRRIVVAIKNLASSEISKRFEQFKKTLPTNLEIVEYATMPFEVMESFISEAQISPLVRGDISVSQAISSLRTDKAFVYEMSSWKRLLTRSMIEFFAQFGVSIEKLIHLVIYPEALARDELKIEAAKDSLAKTLMDQDFMYALHGAFVKSNNQLDLINNTIRQSQFEKIFALDSGHKDVWLHEKLFGLFIKGRTAAESIAYARKNLKWWTTPEDRFLNALFLLKTEAGLSPQEIELAVAAFAQFPTSTQPREMDKFYSMAHGLVYEFLKGPGCPSAVTLARSILSEVDLHSPYRNSLLHGLSSVLDPRGKFRGDPFTMLIDDLVNGRVAILFLIKQLPLKHRLAAAVALCDAPPSTANLL